MGAIDPPPSERVRKILFGRKGKIQRQKTFSDSVRAFMSVLNSHFERFEDILTPVNRDWYQRHPTETSSEASMITRAYFKTHKVVHYAVIFTFWYSRKSFYHYTECINNPASGAPPNFQRGLSPLHPRWGHSLQTPFAARSTIIWTRPCMTVRR